jgi:hypothetical protein
LSDLFFKVSFQKNTQQSNRLGCGGSRSDDGGSGK